jgi:hypothetical protein
MTVSSVSRLAAACSVMVVASVVALTSEPMEQQNKGIARRNTKDGRRS